MATKPLHLATSMTRKNYNSIGETFFSSNRRFDTAAYTGQRAQPNIDVRLRIHEENIRGLVDGSWRIGAADLMPLEFSTWPNEYVPGPFCRA